MGDAQTKRANREAFLVVQEGEGAQPLVFVLAGYGDAWVANGLARALGETYPVYGLQPPGGQKWGQGTARELATMYVEKLRERQPHGPYCLSGYSAGAVMALEIARQLGELGETVASVALLDPLFLRYTRFELRCYELLQAVCRAASPLIGKWRVMKILAAMFADHGLDQHLTALAGYEPPGYAGAITFYRARWSFCGSPRLAAQWRRIAPQMKLAKVPGDHHTFIRPPHVSALAQSMRLAMPQTRARAAQ